VVILLVLVIFGAYFMILKKPTGFIPLEDEGRVYITFELPEASSSTRTQEVMKKIRDVLGGSKRSATIPRLPAQRGYGRQQTEQRHNILHAQTLG